MFLTIIMTLIVVGVLLWAVNTYLPMAAPIKSILNAVTVLFVIIWLLQVLGLFQFVDFLHIRPIK